MSLWLRVRAVRPVFLTVALTLTALTLPASALAATPSPAGATVAAACFLALAVPVAVGWGCARADALLESVSTRPLRVLDLAFVGLAVGLWSLAALTMEELGLARAGAVAARASLAYLGFMLMVYPVAGWRVAATVPAVYLLLVAVVGRGDDGVYPASWAWIAADGSDAGSWVLTLIVLTAGIGVYAVLRHRPIASVEDP